MDPVQCAGCGKTTERPRHFRQKEYCSSACINAAIKARAKRIEEASLEKQTAPEPQAES